MTKQIHLRIDDNLYNILSENADKSELSINDFVVSMIMK